MNIKKIKNDFNIHGHMVTYNMAQVQQSHNIPGSVAALVSLLLLLLFFSTPVISFTSSLLPSLYPPSSLHSFILSAWHIQILKSSLQLNPTSANTQTD